MVSVMGCTGCMKVHGGRCGRECEGVSEWSVTYEGWGMGRLRICEF
jgi:hypothetical protein